MKDEELQEVLDGIESKLLNISTQLSIVTMLLFVLFLKSCS